MTRSGRIAALVFAIVASSLAGGAATTQPATRPAQNTLAKPADIAKMNAAMPMDVILKGNFNRHVLVFGRAADYVHGSIPLGCDAVAALGHTSGAYTATISYDPAAFSPSSLANFDAVVLV